MKVVVTTFESGCDWTIGLPSLHKLKPMILAMIPVAFPCILTVSPLFVAPQINFFQDHTKIILCPLMAAVTYIDDRRDVRTYRLSLIAKHGCSLELESRLRYALSMVDRLMVAQSASAGGSRAKSARAT